MGLSFGSVCSGIEAASVAWNPLGWEAVWFAEVDKAASAVLAHRFPDIPNHGDMTTLAARVRAREIPAPDALVGGTPCQSFSIAGLRRSLDDPRGQLTLAFVDLANAIDEVRIADGKPSVIIVWENVTGVFTAKQNAFGCFLAGIAGEDCELQPPGRKWTHAGIVAGPQRAVAWRVLNAEYFGLAQRRNRVFLVASAGEGFDPGAILFEFDGVRRDSAPSRQPGEEVACDVVPSLTSSGRGIARTGETRGQDPVVAERHGAGCVCGLAGIAFPVDLAPTLNAHFGSKQGLENQHIDGGAGLFVPHLLPFDTTQITSPGNYSSPQAGDPCHPLAAQAHVPIIAFPANLSGTQFASTEDLSPTIGAKNPTAIAFSCKDYGGDAAVDHSPTLRSMGHDGSHANGGGQVAVAYGFQPRIARNGRGDMGDVINALNAQSGETGKGDAAPCAAYLDELPSSIVQLYRWVVRRLMPIECERLQGFPDNHTLVPTGKNGKLAADGPRYKQLGNSMAVPCMRWIGERIANHLAQSPLIGHNGGPPLDEYDSLLG